MGFSLVICWPTMLMSFGPNNSRPKEIPSAPTAMTQIGMVTFAATSPIAAVWTMAARGPTALATSFAPCAKESSAAEQIRGIAKSLRKDWFRFSSPTD